MRNSAVNILVVDDDADLRRAVGIRLTIAGHRVQQAASGEEALRACAECAPDVVILDVNLPDADGFAICDSIRRTVNRADLSVVFLTGAARERLELPLERRCRDAGGDYYLVKPHDPELLVQLVDEIAGTRAGASL